MKYFIKVNGQEEKERAYFLLIVFLNLVIFSVIVTGVLIGIKGYVSDTKFTYKAVTCCGGICSKCIFTLHTLATSLPWFCVAILFTGIGKAIYKAVQMLFMHGRFIRSLTPRFIVNCSGLKESPFPAHLENQWVLFENAALRYAFTSGIWKPKIYLSTGICSYLTAKELQSVILHEAHHIRQKAPFKLFVLQILSALNFFLPVNRHLLGRYSSLSEKAADDAAVKISGEPLELASALLKLSRFRTLAALSPAVAFSREQGIIEERIMRILEPEAAPPCLFKTFSYLSSVFIVVVICLPLFFPLFQLIDRTDCKARVCHTDKCAQS
ncbi:MAG: hypothetical protein DCC43_02965 [Candidatus Brocadia sp.]|nr:hypothetical protein [Candidatus Brocadia fulgida]MCC6324314.1 M56 family metallopeptidase [Candidatus Brocadia sp.]MCE7910435.1 M56 family peptidase [Candidatus Brocadia sp. AMX3]MDG5995463.1 M56 family peptidase [Candidatus Brocadia sp.]RIK02526.1 MAG: hypothetical protein DCC43_02965 [Candidatus Brocadia sp.]